MVAWLLRILQLLRMCKLSSKSFYNKKSFMFSVQYGNGRADTWACCVHGKVQWADGREMEVDSVGRDQPDGSASMRGGRLHDSSGRADD